MKKNTIQFDTPVDALVALTKRIAKYETRFEMATEEFFDLYKKGKIDDSEDFTEWSNDYQHYLSIRRDLLNRLQNAA